MIHRDDFDEHMLSTELEHAKKGSAKLDRIISGLFGYETVKGWTRSFEKAAVLFDEQFGRSQEGWKHGDHEWNRESYYNGCNGCSWTLTGGPDDIAYMGWGETDALALCAAMVKAKRKEQRT